MSTYLVYITIKQRLQALKKQRKRERVRERERERERKREKERAVFCDELTEQKFLMM